MARSSPARAARTRGRPKGSRNKITNEAKQAILRAFDAIGGWQRLADWIKKDPANEKIYWSRIFPRLLPRAPVEPPPERKELPPVRGALIWEPPTPSPYPPLRASTGVVGLVAGNEAAGEIGSEAWSP